MRMSSIARSTVARRRGTVTRLTRRSAIPRRRSSITGLNERRASSVRGRGTVARSTWIT